MHRATSPQKRNPPGNPVAWKSVAGALRRATGHSAPIVFATLLVLTVGAKFSLPAISTPADAIARAEHDVAAFLVSQDFALQGVRQDDASLPLISAARGDCRLTVAPVSPLGVHRDIIRQLAGPRDRVRFVVEGTVYDDQPQWRTWRLYYWQRLNRRLGRRLPVRPVLGIIASPGCTVQAIPWRDIAGLP